MHNLFFKRTCEIHRVASSDNQTAFGKLYVSRCFLSSFTRSVSYSILSITPRSRLTVPKEGTGSIEDNEEYNDGPPYINSKKHTFLSS